MRHIQGMDTFADTAFGWRLVAEPDYGVRDPIAIAAAIPRKDTSQ